MILTLQSLWGSITLNRHYQRGNKMFKCQLWCFWPLSMNTLTSYLQTENFLFLQNQIKVCFNAGKGLSESILTALHWTQKNHAKKALHLSIIRTWIYTLALIIQHWLVETSYFICSILDTKLTKISAFFQVGWY